MTKTAEYAAEQKNFGNMYYNGWGVTKNEEKAQSFYKKAWDAYKSLSDNGDIDAQYEIVKLAEVFDINKWLAKNTFVKHKAQANKSDLKAKIRLGLLYAQGIGVDKNINAAKKILDSVKDKIKFVNAELISLCIMVGDIEDALKFHSRAAQLFEIAALSENNADSLELAKLYSDKKSVEEVDENFVKNLYGKFQPNTTAYENSPSQAELETEEIIKLAQSGNVNEILQLKQLSADGNEQATSALENLYYDGDKSHAVGTVVLRDDLETIEAHSFRGNTDLKTVILPESLKTIGDGAFRGCNGLTEIKFPDNLNSIGYGSFSYCQSLTEVNFNDALTAIGESAFEGCSSLTKIKFSNALMTIGADAFEECPINQVTYYEKTENILREFFGDRWDGIEKNVLY